MIVVLVASTVSSIAGFAFSALCGALLFHLIDSAVHAVQVMVVCTIAIRAWFGLHIFKRLSDRQFEFAVDTLLILFGIGLTL